MGERRQCRQERRRWTRAGKAAAATVGLAAALSGAAPVTSNVTVGETLDQPTTIVFNVHENALAAGAPAPIYVLDNLTQTDGPQSLTVDRVGNACIEVSWDGEDNIEGLPFTVGYNLIAGDQSTTQPGTINFTLGQGTLANVNDPATGCDDPNNSPPQTTPATFDFGPGQPFYVMPIITEIGPALDPDGNETLRFTDLSCWTQPQGGTVSTNIEFPNSIIFTPDAGFSGGTTTFEYCVTDNPLSTQTGVTGSVTVSIQAAQTTELVDDAATTTGLDQVFIDVLANDTIADGQFITGVSQTTGGGFANIASQAQCATQIPGIETPCVSYSPPSSDMQGNPFVGDDTFTYSVGTVDGGPSQSANVTVTVLPEAPIVADDTAQTVTDTPIDIDVRANDTVLDGESITAVSAPANGGTAVVLSAAVCAEEFGTGTTTECVRYSPPVTETVPFDGVDTFTYTVSNGPVSSTATVSVTVTAEQTVMRELVADAATTPVGQVIVIDVLGNDTLADGDELLSVTAPASGGSVEILDVQACLAADDDFFQPCVQYTPPPADANGVVFIGDDSFSYVVGNSDDTTTSTVTVSVVAPDGTPQPVADDAADVEAGETVEIDVLANDLDDGGAENLQIVGVTDPANGSAIINTNEGAPQTLSYTPNEGFVGTDTFFYTVSDGDPQTPNQAAQVSVTVTATGGPNTLASLAQTPQQIEVARAIDNVCAALRQGEVIEEEKGGRPVSQAPTAEGIDALRQRCTALIEYANPTNGEDTSDEVREALDQIAGEEVFAQSTLSTLILNTQIKNIDSRIAALRAGARGVSVQGLALNVGGQALPGALLSANTWRGGGASADDAPEDERGNALLEDSRLGLFMNGRLNFGDQGPTSTENGFDFETLGITAGADYRFRNDLAIGAAIGFANADADYNGTSGELDSDSLTYTLYGTYFTDRVYIDVLAGFGDIDFDSARTLRFADAAGGVDTVAQGATDGDQRLVSANFGVNLDRNGWLFVPFIGYDYIDTNIDSFIETEGQGWELAFDEQKVQSQIVSAGLRMSYTKSMRFGVLVPHLRVAYQRELEDDLRVLTARFANDPTNTRFRFFTDAPDSDFMQVAAGLSMVLENGVSGFIDYETITGYDNLDSSTLTFGLRFERRFR